MHGFGKSFFLFLDLDQSSLRSSSGQRRPNGTSAIPVALVNGEVDNFRTPDGGNTTTSFSLSGK